MRTASAIACILFLAFSPAVLGEPPSTEDIREAKKLARKAKRLVRQKRWGEAAPLYGRAEGLNPIWDYAFALAQGHAKSSALVASWRALVRAASHGVPDRRRKDHTKLYESVEERLLKTHAFVKLKVVPEGASVRIGNQDWLPPWVNWVERRQSVLVVEHPECIPLRVTWRHRIGARSLRTIRLTLKSKWGRLKVSGKPDGATIRFGGKSMGQLPEATSKLMKPGEYSLRIEAPKYVSVKTTARVDAGLTNEIAVVLPPEQGEFVKLLQTKRFWGWVSVGTGGALLITGVGLLGHAASLVSDAEALNADHAAGYDAYSAEYDSITASIPAEVTAGWTTFGLGLALGAGGAALLLLDHFESAEGEQESSSSPRVRVLPSLGGIGAVMSF